jgi:NADH:ubiquinone oxidoreductase subunit F (NADH-binding)
MSVPGLGDVEILEIYLFYDWPQVFSCVDEENDQKYLAIALDEDEDETYMVWMYVSISDARLSSIESGQTSLREAALQAEKGYVYIITDYWEDKSKGSLKTMMVDDIPEDYLAGEDIRFRVK